MKKLLVAGLALSMLSGTAVSAYAQPGYARQEMREQRQDLREARQNLREERQDFRRAQRRYNAGRYVAPRGFAARQWRRGDRLPAAWYGQRYKISNYRAYGLYAPPRGYQWTRVGNDAVLTAVTTGIIAAAVASLFN